MRTAAGRTQAALRNYSKKEGGKVSVYMRFWGRGIYAIKCSFFQVSSSLMKLLLVTRSSHHHGEF